MGSTHSRVEWVTSKMKFWLCCNGEMLSTPILYSPLSTLYMPAENRHKLAMTRPPCQLLTHLHLLSCSPTPPSCRALGAHEWWQPAVSMYWQGNKYQELKIYDAEILLGVFGKEWCETVDMRGKMFKKNTAVTQDALIKQHDAEACDPG